MTRKKSLEDTPNYRKHQNCPMKVVVGPFAHNHAKLVCAKHNKWIQWLSKRDTELLTKDTS